MPVSALSLAVIWNGQLSRVEGGGLVALYIVYVGAIWIFERAPPALGEVEELIEAEEDLANPSSTVRQGRVGIELALAIGGLAAIAIGSTLLVESVR